MKWSDFMKINVIARSDRKDKQYNATGIYNGKCLVVKKGSVVSKKINNGVPKSMIRETEHGLIIRLKIVPNSSKNEIILEDEFIKVKVTAQPIENKANKALIEFLSKQFKIPKTKIQILKGETSKEKTVLLNTDDLAKNSAIISQLTKK